MRVAGSSTPISRLLIMKSETGSLRTDIAMDVAHNSQARWVTQVLNVCPKQPTQRMWRWNRDIQTVIDGKETCPLIVRASRVKKVVANSARATRYTVTCESGLDVGGSRDRKRRKKRGLMAVRGKVTPAPGGCNQKGATG